MKALLIALTLLLLNGCSQKQYYKDNSGNSDVRQCQYEAEKASARFGYSLMGLAKRESIMEMCMKSRGYSY